MKFCSLKCSSHGKFNGRWNGGRKIDNFGYILIWVPREERMGRKFEYIREHRLVMERKLGRRLEFNEIVHHKNGNIKDNRIKNLEIISRGEHSRYHVRKFHAQLASAKPNEYLSSLRRGRFLKYNKV